MPFGVFYQLMRGIQRSTEAFSDYRRKSKKCPNCNSSDTTTHSVGTRSCNKCGHFWI
jgi:ribosomal protein L37AE/L43A